MHHLGSIFSFLWCPPQVVSSGAYSEGKENQNIRNTFSITLMIRELGHENNTIPGRELSKEYLGTVSLLGANRVCH